MTVRLHPTLRDRAIAIIEMLLIGAARLDASVIIAGQRVRPLDVLVDCARSEDRLPALVSEAIARAIKSDVGYPTYGSAALALLLHVPRIEARLAEEQELQRLEADAEKTANRQAQSKAEIAARKQARAERRASKAAMEMVAAA